MARTGHKKDAEASTAEAEGQRLQQWCHGLLVAAKPAEERPTHQRFPAPMHHNQKAEVSTVTPEKKAPMLQ